MKKGYRFLSIIAALVICLFLTVPVFAQTPTPQPGGTTYQGDKLVLANTFRLETGDVLTGDLAVIGSTASLEIGSTVNGDIVLTGGTISIDGTVNGNILAVGGAVNLGDTAVVNGDIVTVGASLKRSPLAKVSGTITEQTPTVFNFGNSNNPLQLPFTSNQDSLTKFLSAAFESLALAALAVVIGLILPEQTKRVASTLTGEPLVTGGVGLLTIVGAPIVLVLLTVTIILIPITVLCVILLALAFLFGWIAVGYEIGERLGTMFHSTWPVPVAGGIGVLVLSLLVGTINLLPCIGWIIAFIIAILGLGAVVISRFGSANYAQKLVQAVIPTTPAAPPTPPQSPEAK